MFWGSGGKWLFIFRELGSTGTYLQGFGEHALSFGDLGSTKKVKKNLTLKDKPSFRLIFFFFNSSASVDSLQTPPPPLII